MTILQNHSAQKNLVLKNKFNFKDAQVISKILNPEIFFGDYILNIETRDFTKSGTRVYLTERGA